VCVCVCVFVCDKSIIDSLNLQPQQGCESSGSHATCYQDYDLPENDAVYFGGGPDVSEEPAGTVHWVTDRGSGFLHKSVQFKEKRNVTSQNVVALLAGRLTPTYSTTILYTYTALRYGVHTHTIFWKNLFEIPHIVTALLYIYYRSILFTGSQIALSL
jgi:hypothetical protein